MKKVRILSVLLAIVMVVSALASCGPDPEPEKAVLRMATGYQKPEHAITFRAVEAIKMVDGQITLADGKTYKVGDLKPTWQRVSSVLGIEFEDKFTGAGSAEKEFNVWKDKLGEVDMVSGTATQLSENGVAGKLVNLAEHLDKMPSFKAYLEANPIVRLSITGNTSNGAIYFSPYFDGVNDIERMPLMRVDWVVKLLDGEGDFTATASNTLKEAVYQPYMPTSGKVEVDAVNPEGTAVIKLTKNYDKAGNIVAKMNAAGTLTGVEAVNMLRDYIDEAYNGHYGTQRSNLFIGQDAAWDADELVALLRCVVANPQTLNGTDTVQGLFSREDDNTQRRVDMFRFAGTLFGARGLESRQDYLYVGTDGLLHDARIEEATYVALENMNAMAKEGLISQSFVDSTKASSGTMLEGDLGFMHYDYNQTQTVLNETKLNGAGTDKEDSGEKYMAVMVPVARWNDGSEKYMRFTESWRSVKTDGWAISAAGVAGDEAKLNAALALIDYAYSAAGQILMSYGPDEFIKRNADGSYVTFNFNGKQMPVISDATYEELWELADGNYTNYARYYLGSTLSFVKSQAFEYQCTHVVGKEGAGHISTAIGLGTIKHPELALASNPWYTIVPTTLPNTKVETDKIAGYPELSSKGKFSQSKGNENLLLKLICGGYGEGTGEEGMTNRAETIAKIRDDWNVANYLKIKNDAWTRLQDFYKNLK